MAYIEAIVDQTCGLCPPELRQKATKRIRTNRNAEWGVACAKHAEAMLRLAQEAEDAANARDAKAFRDHLGHQHPGGQN